MKKQFIEAGKFVGTHGIRGEMRLEPWCDGPEFLTNFKKLYLDNKGEKVLEVTNRAHKNMVLCSAKGVSTIEEAECYRGKIVYINRDDVKLEKGRHFVQDLLDLEVFDVETGDKIGVLTDVTKTGANDVWTVTANGKEYLIPVIDEVVKEVDVDGGRVTVFKMKGLFDDED